MANDNKSFSALLTNGLQSGYGSSSKLTKINREGFEGKQSLLEGDGGKYVDQWFADTLGGGQELVEVDGHKFTRLYGGGTPNAEILESLSISAEQVSAYLKGVIMEAGSRTRLFEEYFVDNGDGWVYSYNIIKTDESIPVILASEEIFYKGTRVHWHLFILSPIK